MYVCMQVQTANAILRHSGIDDNLFIGTGRHGVVENQCLEAGMAMFQLLVLGAEEIWEDVPPNLRPQMMQHAVVDLFAVRNALICGGLAE